MPRPIPVDKVAPSCNNLFQPEICAIDIICAIDRIIFVRNTEAQCCIQVCRYTLQCVNYASLNIAIRSLCSNFNFFLFNLRQMNLYFKDEFKGK